MVIVARSPVVVPAEPEIAGVLLAVVLPAGGEVRVTIGAVVSTVNVRAALLPVLPLLSFWLAWAV